VSGEQTNIASWRGSSDSVTKHIGHKQEDYMQWAGHAWRAAITYFYTHMIVEGKSAIGKSPIIGRPHLR